MEEEYGVRCKDCTPHYKTLLHSRRKIHFLCLHLWTAVSAGLNFFIKNFGFEFCLCTEGFRPTYTHSLTHTLDLPVGCINTIRNDFYSTYLSTWLLSQKVFVWTMADNHKDRQKRVMKRCVVCTWTNQPEGAHAKPGDILQVKRVFWLDQKISKFFTLYLQLSSLILPHYIMCESFIHRLCCCLKCDLALGYSVLPFFPLFPFAYCKILRFTFKV